MSPTQSLHGPAKGQSTVGHAMHGAGQSSVGQPSFYEAGDQRNEPRSVIAERDRYTEGTKGSHKNLDSKDERSIANKLSSAQERKHESTHRKNVGNIEVEISKRDPTMPVCLLSCPKFGLTSMVGICADMSGAITWE